MSPLKLDGSNGISGIDGTVNRPAVVGIDTTTGLQFGTNEVSIVTGGTEQVKVDSSGRLLVGTPSSSTADTLVLQDNSSSTNDVVVVRMRRGGTPSANSDIGLISFEDGSSNAGAEIRVTNDTASSWGSGDYPARITFSTTADGASSPTERMRIAKNGAVMFLKTTTANIFVDGFEVNNTGTGAQLLLTNSGNGTVAMYINCRYGAGYQYPMQFYYGTSHVGSIRISGTVTDYLTTSDYRLKENVVEITDGIDRIKQLRPSRFNFIANPSVTVDGFIAHEAQTVVPEAVSGEHNGVQTWKETDELPEGVSVGDPKLDEDGNTIPEYQGIDQSKLVPLLTAALQEAIAKIETLEASNAALETRLTALEGGAS